MVYRAPNDQDEGDIESGTRVCTKCHERKPMLQFSFATDRRYRRRTCKECAELARLGRVEADPDRFRIYSQTYSLKKYGLSVLGYERMVLERQNKCDICHEQMTPPHVDHDHVTGKVRGLLCFTCNTALGKLHDSITMLESAITYLKESSS